MDRDNYHPIPDGDLSYLQHNTTATSDVTCSSTVPLQEAFHRRQQQLFDKNNEEQSDAVKNTTSSGPIDRRVNSYHYDGKTTIYVRGEDGGVGESDGATAAAAKSADGIPSTVGLRPPTFFDQQQQISYDDYDNDGKQRPLSILPHPPASAGGGMGQKGEGATSSNNNTNQQHISTTDAAAMMNTVADHSNSARPFFLSPMSEPATPLNNGGIGGGVGASSATSSPTAYIPTAPTTMLSMVAAAVDPNSAANATQPAHLFLMSRQPQQQQQQQQDPASYIYGAADLVADNYDPDQQPPPPSVQRGGGGRKKGGGGGNAAGDPAAFRDSLLDRPATTTAVSGCGAADYHGDDNGQQFPLQHQSEENEQAAHHRRQQNQNNNDNGEGGGNGEIDSLHHQYNNNYYSSAAGPKRRDSDGTMNTTTATDANGDVMMAMFPYASSSSPHRNKRNHSPPEARHLHHRYEPSLHSGGGDWRNNYAVGDGDGDANDNNSLRSALDSHSGVRNGSGGGLLLSRGSGRGVVPPPAALAVQYSRPLQRHLSREGGALVAKDTALPEGLPLTPPAPPESVNRYTSSHRRNGGSALRGGDVDAAKASSIASVTSRLQLSGVGEDDDDDDEMGGANAIVLRQPNHAAVGPAAAAGAFEVPLSAPSSPSAPQQQNQQHANNVKKTVTILEKENNTRNNGTVSVVGSAAVATPTGRGDDRVTSSSRGHHHRPRPSGSSRRRRSGSNGGGGSDVPPLSPPQPPSCVSKCNALVSRQWLRLKRWAKAEGPITRYIRDSFLQPHVSISTLAALGIFIAVVTTTTISIVVLTLTATSDAQEIAKITSDIVATACASQIYAELSGATDAADALQFSVLNRDYMPMPTDDFEESNNSSSSSSSSTTSGDDATATDWYRNSVWYDKWHRLALAYSRQHHTSLISQLSFAFADGNFAGCQGYNGTGETIRCVSTRRRYNPYGNPEVDADKYRLNPNFNKFTPTPAPTAATIALPPFNNENGFLGGGGESDSKNVSSAATTATTVKPTDEPVSPNATTRRISVTLYNKEDGRLISNVKSTTANVDLREKLWYKAIIDLGRAKIAQMNEEVASQSALVMTTTTVSPSSSSSDEGLSSTFPLAWYKAWTSLHFAPHKSKASLVLSFSMVNHSTSHLIENFIGVASFNVEFDALSTFINAIRPTAGTRLAVLDGSKKVMAATGDDPSQIIPVFTTRNVPVDYVLSPADLADKCVLSDFTSGEDDYGKPLPTAPYSSHASFPFVYRELFCQVSVEDVKIPYLTALALNYPSVLYQYIDTTSSSSSSTSSSSDPYASSRRSFRSRSTNDDESTSVTGVAAGSVGTSRFVLDGEAVWTSIIQAPDPVDWTIAIFVPEDDLIGAMHKARTVISVTCTAAILIFMVIVVIMLKLLLQPLQHIAESMLSATYLQQEEDADGEEDAYERKYGSKRYRRVGGGADGGGIGEVDYSSSSSSSDDTSSSSDDYSDASGDENGGGLAGKSNDRAKLLATTNSNGNENDDDQFAIEMREFANKIPPTTSATTRMGGGDCIPADMPTPPRYTRIPSGAVAATGGVGKANVGASSADGPNKEGADGKSATAADALAKKQRDEQRRERKLLKKKQRREEKGTAADDKKTRRRRGDASSNSNKKPPVRKLSLLSDIAMLQKAYWVMVDEIKAFRGYIPEHICREILATAAAGVHGMNGSGSGNGNGLFSAASASGAAGVDGVGGASSMMNNSETIPFSNIDGGGGGGPSGAGGGGSTGSAALMYSSAAAAAAARNNNNMTELNANNKKLPAEQHQRRREGEVGERGEGARRNGGSAQTRRNHNRARSNNNGDDDYDDDDNDGHPRLPLEARYLNGGTDPADDRRFNQSANGLSCAMTKSYAANDGSGAFGAADGGGGRPLTLPPNPITHNNTYGTRHVVNEATAFANANPGGYVGFGLSLFATFGDGNDNCVIQPQPNESPVLSVNSRPTNNNTEATTTDYNNTTATCDDEFTSELVLAGGSSSQWGHSSSSNQKRIGAHGASPHMGSGGNNHQNLLLPPHPSKKVPFSTGAVNSGGGGGRNDGGNNNKLVVSYGEQRRLQQLADEAKLAALPQNNNNNKAGSVNSRNAHVTMVPSSNNAMVGTRHPSRIQDHASSPAGQQQKKRTASPQPHGRGSGKRKSSPQDGDAAAMPTFTNDDSGDGGHNEEDDENVTDLSHVGPSEMALRLQRERLGHRKMLAVSAHANLTSSANGAAAAAAGTTTQQSSTGAHQFSYHGNTSPAAPKKGGAGDNAAGGAGVTTVNGNGIKFTIAGGAAAAAAKANATAGGKPNSNTSGGGGGSSADQQLQQQQVFFSDNILVDRDVSIVLVNIVGFHQYAMVTHGPDVSKHHEVVVSYLNSVAIRCGGVLDTFSGDKFWISFNATSKCGGGSSNSIAIAAVCFAFEVASFINKEAAEAKAALTKEHEMRRRNGGNDPLLLVVNQQPPPNNNNNTNASASSNNTNSSGAVISNNNNGSAKHHHKYRPRFKAALQGVTVGVATGRAYVGPLGTRNIRRHSIISNAVTEAAALERQCGRYPDCAVMIGGDMIPAVEGYAQYLLIDACALPGSNGKRRRIASVKGLMCAAGCNPLLLRGGVVGSAVPIENPYQVVNDFFSAFLEGRLEECVLLMRRLDTEAGQSQQYWNAVEARAAIMRQYHAYALQLQQSHKEKRENMLREKEEKNNKKTPSAAPSSTAAAREQDAHQQQQGGDGSPLDDDDDHVAVEDAPSPFVMPPAPELPPLPCITTLSEVDGTVLSTTPITPIYTSEQCEHVAVMLQFVWSLLSQNPPCDGRSYRSPLGEAYVRRREE